MAKKGDDWFSMDASTESSRTETTRKKEKESVRSSRVEAYDQEIKRQSQSKMLVFIFIAVVMVGIIAFVVYNLPQNQVKRLVKPLYEDSAMTVVRDDISVNTVQNTKSDVLELIDDNFFSFLVQGNQVTEQTDKIETAMDVVEFRDFINNYNNKGDFTAEDALYFATLVDNLKGNVCVDEHSDDIQSIWDHQDYICNYILSTYISTMNTTSALKYLEENEDLFETFASDETYTEYKNMKIDLYN
jgi:hypothetical protein